MNNKTTNTKNMKNLQKMNFAGLKRLEENAIEFVDWLKLSKHYLNIFSGEDDSIRCLRKAEKYISTDSTLVALECASAWKGQFNNNFEADKNLSLAEEIGVYNCNVNQLVTVSRFWRDLLDNKNYSIRSLEKAELYANHCIDWNLIAEVWATNLNDFERGEKCAIRALNDASFIYDWLECSKIWAKLKNLKIARECIVEAEKLAQSGSDLIRCAEVWFLTVHLAEDSKRCLANAEKKAISFSNWIDLAQAWDTIFKDKKEVKRCLPKDITSGISSFENACSEWWKLLE